MFSSGGFAVLDFTCRSKIHFQLIFIYHMKYVLKISFFSFLLHTDVQLFQLYWLKKILFLKSVYDFNQTPVSVC